MEEENFEKILWFSPQKIVMGVTTRPSAPQKRKFRDLLRLFTKPPRPQNFLNSALPTGCGSSP